MDFIFKHVLFQLIYRKIYRFLQAENINFEQLKLEISNVDINEN